MNPRTKRRSRTYRKNLLAKCQKDNERMQARRIMDDDPEPSLFDQELQGYYTSLRAEKARKGTGQYLGGRPYPARWD